MSYTKILCNDGFVISLGGRQRDFLDEAGIIVPLDSHNSWGAPDHSIDEINAITMSERSLLDCDLCMATDPTHKLDCKRFELREGPNRGGTLGGPQRPVFICSECLPYVRKGRTAPLVDHLCRLYVERAREQGVLAARASIAPLVRDIVSGILHNAKGEPQDL